MNRYGVLDAGSKLSAACGDLVRAVDSMAALERPLSPAEQGAVFDAVGKVGAVLIWVTALAEGRSDTGATGRLPAIRRAGTGSVAPTLDILAAARSRLKSAGRPLAQLAESGYRPDDDGRIMIAEIAERIANALDWVTVLAEHGGITDERLAALLDR